MSLATAIRKRLMQPSDTETTEALAYTDFSTEQTLGTYIGDRVYLYRIPQTASLPAIKIDEIDVTYINTLQGDSGMRDNTMQVDVWTADPGGADAARKIGDIVVKLMSGWQGDSDDHYISSVMTLRDHTLAQIPRDASDQWHYQRSIDFRIFAVEHEEQNGD